MDNHKILIVDDDLLIGKYIVSSLENCESSFKCKHYSNPLLLRDDNEWYDLIVVDINMPQMSGIELVKTIRLKDIYKDTPIVFYSTITATEEKLRVFEDDIRALAFINKSSGGIEALINEIRSIFWKELTQKNSKDLTLIRETGKALSHHSGQFLQVIRSYAELINVKCSESEDPILNKLASYSKVIIKNSEKLDDLVGKLQRIKSVSFVDIGEGDRIIDVENE